MSKVIYGLLFLPVIGYLGFVTSFEDFLISKIRNKWILIGVLYALIVYMLSWILYGLAFKKIVSVEVGIITSYLVWHFDKWCINLIVSIVVAYLLWHFKIWGAGDAKLFICYSALIPIGQYSKVYFNYYFASFLLLLTIFIPATFFIFLRSIFYFIKRFNLSKIKEKTPELIKEKFTKSNKIEKGKVLLGFFVLFLFFKILWEGLQNLAGKYVPNQNILMVISILTFQQLSKFFKKNIRFVIGAFVLLIAYVAFKLVYSWEQFILEIGSTLVRVMFIMILFPIFKKIIDLYADRTIKKTMPFAPWMFLGTLIVWFI